MTHDPAGYYAVLGVDPAATPEAITAAYRRKARVLHPDVPGTGDAAAFIRLKQAYDALSNAHHRGTYDRSAGAAMPAPLEAEPAWRGPRLSNLPIALWAGLGGVLCVAAVMVVVQFNRPRPAAQPQPPVNRTTTAAAPAAVPRPLPQVVATGSGATTHYVRAAGDDAVLWVHDIVRDAYMPAGHVAAFSPVQALRLVPEHGLVEVRLADGGGGFIDAARLAPGDREIARRAYCAYNAGPSPRNGEILGRDGDVVARIEISNRGPQPVLVKLRDASGHIAATVFVTPGNSAVVDNLPDTVYRPEFATGELWSGACNGFAAGTRAQRYTYFASPSGLSPLVIPPSLSVAPAPEDISDAEFERE
jgi:hypothetical protein